MITMIRVYMYNNQNVTMLRVLLFTLKNENSFLISTYDEYSKTFNIA